MLLHRTFVAALRKAMQAGVVLAATIGTMVPAWAQEPLPLPTGPVILSVSGTIAVTNNGDSADFDREMLYALGLGDLETTTAWTDGVQSFRGVTLQKVLERVGAEGTTVTATALNDFVTSFPFSDAQQYGVLLAAFMNGEEMPVRDRGPLWIVYPRDDFPELQQPEYNDRWAWQLRSLEIR